MPKEILLTEHELKQLLDGTLHWSDIAPRLTAPAGRRAAYKPENQAPDLSSGKQEVCPETKTDKEIPEFLRNNDPYEEDLSEVRDLLYGQGTAAHKMIAGRKVAFLLALSGLSVVSLWLYFLFSA